MISAADDDWTAVAKNLARARKVWSRMSRILRREGSAPRVSGLFFKSMVQAVLIFGADTWVVPPPHGQGTGGISDPGVEKADGTAHADDNGREVEIHLCGGSKVGGRILDDGGVYQAAPEHGRTVNRYTITVRTV